MTEHGFGIVDSKFAIKISRQKLSYDILYVLDYIQLQQCTKNAHFFCSQWLVNSIICIIAYINGYKLYKTAAIIFLSDSYLTSLLKICYDNPRNVPNKGRNFNTQKFGKMYIFVICMISRHWFQTTLLLYIA